MSQTPELDGIQLGIYRLLRTGGPTRDEGETTRGMPDTGMALEFSVIGANDIHLTLHDTRWSNGERDVRVVRRHGTPELYDEIVGRLRLEVRPSGLELVVDLRQARPGRRGDRPQLHNASLIQLDTGAGTSVTDALRRLGGRVGTKAELLERIGKTRENLCCVFDPGAELLPAAVFVLTRVAPVGTGYTG